MVAHRLECWTNPSIGSNVELVGASVAAAASLVGSTALEVGDNRVGFRRPLVHRHLLDLVVHDAGVEHQQMQEGAGFGHTLLGGLDGFVEFRASDTVGLDTGRVDAHHAHSRDDAIDRIAIRPVLLLRHDDFPIVWHALAHRFPYEETTAKQTSL